MNAERILLFLVCFLFLSFDVGAKAKDIGCTSPQYVSTGSEGVINCSFRKGFYSLLWYSSPDVFHSEAVLTMVGSVKSGPGYLSGEFDIYPNGSLIIYNVSLENEGTFTAIILETPTSDAIRYVVDVIITAPTLSRLPLILECRNEGRICFRILPLHTEVSCKIQDARPAISLHWMVRTNSGDRNVSSSLSITNGTHPFFTSLATTSALFTFSSTLALLVCKADSPSGLLENDESLILIQNGVETLSSVPSVIKYVERGSRLVLNCTVSKRLYFVWQVQKPLETVFSNILFAVFVEGNLQSHIEDHGYNLHSEGTLFIDDVGTEDEGTYRCISSNGMEDDLLQYDVTVFVIDGCEGQHYCVLEMEPEGDLTCVVRGIRPWVQLKIIVSDDQSSTAFLLYGQQSTTQSNGDVFDISLTSKYRLNDASKTRVTIECKVIGTDIEQLNLSTKLDILFLNNVYCFVSQCQLMKVECNKFSDVVE
ncbi:Immunoglobulin superfamily member 10 [Holothuria leucospilota]|uniref:Immunoglobulin superfamily member 10 n=1 Tax=Holothuria leucospilota TaxID=206669 RepID=A0A9Q0Y8Z0_HOLLE|nr:Immunoglobulin superfamily member 10 [Holothuria leucospilota]